MTAITLRCNNVKGEVPCVLCGGRCYPDGFDFFLGDTSYPVCDRCAEHSRPDLVEIKAQTWRYSEQKMDLVRGYWFGLVQAFELSIEDLYSLVEKCLTDDDLLFIDECVFGSDERSEMRQKRWAEMRAERKRELSELPF